MNDDCHHRKKFNKISLKSINDTSGGKLQCTTAICIGCIFSHVFQDFVFSMHSCFASDFKPVFHFGHIIMKRIPEHVQTESRLKNSLTSGPIHAHCTLISNILQI